MEMNTLCKDLWERFCKLDDTLKVFWIEEHSDMHMIVIASTDFNEWCRVGYGNNNFIGFFEDLKNYVDVFKYLNTHKKWICVATENGWVRCTDSLTEVEARLGSLLREFRDSQMKTLFGYTEEEMKAITKELEKLDENEIHEVWNRFMEERGV